MVFASLLYMSLCIYVSNLFFIAEVFIFKNINKVSVQNHILLFYKSAQGDLSVFTHQPNFEKPNFRLKEKENNKVQVLPKLVQEVIAGHHDPPGQRGHLCRGQVPAGGATGRTEG